MDSCVVPLLAEAVSAGGGVGVGEALTAGALLTVGVVALSRPLQPATKAAKIMSTMPSGPANASAKACGFVREEGTHISIACIGRGIRHRILGVRIKLCRSEEEAAWPGKC